MQHVSNSAEQFDACMTRHSFQWPLLNADNWQQTGAISHVEALLMDYVYHPSPSAHVGVVVFHMHVSSQL
jgi:hypothetical protein